MPGCAGNSKRRWWSATTDPRAISISSPPNPVQAAAQAAYARAPIPEVPAAAFRTPGGLTFLGVGGLPRDAARDLPARLHAAAGSRLAVPPQDGDARRLGHLLRAGGRGFQRRHAARLQPALEHHTQQRQRHHLCGLHLQPAAERPRAAAGSIGGHVDVPRPEPRLQLGGRTAAVHAAVERVAAARAARELGRRNRVHGEQDGAAAEFHGVQCGSGAVSERPARPRPARDRQAFRQRDQPVLRHSGLRGDVVLLVTDHRAFATAAAVPAFLRPHDGPAGRLGVVQRADRALRAPLHRRPAAASQLHLGEDARSHRLPEPHRQPPRARRQQPGPAAPHRAHRDVRAAVRQGEALRLRRARAFSITSSAAGRCRPTGSCRAGRRWPGAT